MTNQHQRRAARARRFRPAAVVAVLAVVLLGAITGVSVLTSNAAAFSGLTGSGAHRSSGAARGTAGAGIKGSQSSAGSTATGSPAADPAQQAAGAQPATSAPAAQLPPLNSPSPSPSTSPSQTPSASPSDSPSSSPSDSPTDATPASPAPETTDTRSAPTTTITPPGPEANRVGALFSGSVGPGNHFCTASVVHSPGHNLILTAAHCVGTTSGVTFVPGYREGKAPFGSFPATKISTTNGWAQSSDPDQDFAFIQLGPNSSGQQVEDVVGAENLGLNESFTATVRLYGYPDTTDDPIVCSNATTQQSAYQRRIECPAYPNGTSGGPWISTATGNVIGVIGGYQQGGDTDDVSYSAYFDSTIGNLYRTATGT